MGWLANFHVLKEYRKRKVGSLLWNALIDRMKSAGVTDFALSTYYGTPISQFYKKQGFGTNPEETRQIYFGLNC